MSEKTSSAEQSSLSRQGKGERLPAGRQGLAERRRRKRRYAVGAMIVLLVLLTGAALWGTWQNPVRISHIETYGADERVATIAADTVQGSYLGIIPRDSIFFFPARNIRANVLDSFPQIAAISITRNGLSGISIKIHERVAIARWCGLAPTAGVEEYCYVFDANGYIFAAAATTTQTLNNFALYVSLVGDILEPLRATIAHAEQLPSVFDFARQLSAFGSTVSKIVIRADEVDDYLASGTRITYLLGDEQNAFTSLTSAKADLNLSDSSLDYVDLRFDGKVYLKKKAGI